MDLGATFSAANYWSNDWKNPRLDSRTGIHCGHGAGDGNKNWW